jgi:hypothetical protein
MHAGALSYPTSCWCEAALCCAVMEMWCIPINLFRMLTALPITPFQVHSITDIMSGKQSVIFDGKCANQVHSPTHPPDTQNPTQPSDSSDPTHRTDSSDPTDSTDPTDPTDPTDSTDPADLNVPTDPTDPTDTTDPADLADSADSADSTDSTDPTNHTGAG